MIFFYIAPVHLLSVSYKWSLTIYSDGHNSLIPAYIDFPLIIFLPFLFLSGSLEESSEVSLQESSCFPLYFNFLISALTAMNICLIFIFSLQAYITTFHLTETCTAPFFRCHMVDRCVLDQLYWKLTFRK